MNCEDVFGANKKLNEIEINSNKLILESMPVRLMFVPTSKCNLRCIMCDRILHDSTLPFEAVRKIFPLLPYLELIDIQGGEPFLVDYFEELFFKLVSTQKTTISLLTNGLLINKKWADLLIRDNVHLSFSIDSVRKDTYEYIRKGAKFEDLLKSIDLINELREKRNVKNPSNKINTVVMKCNYKELYLLPRFCKRYAFSDLTFDYLRPEVAPYEDIFTVGYDPIAISFLNEILPEIEAECNELGIEFNFHGLSPFLNSNSNEKIDIKSDTIQDKVCKLPWKKLFIDSDGSIRPDCLCNRAIGNLKEIETIEEVWNNETMQTYRKNIINGTANNWCSETCLMNAVGQRYREGI